MTSRTLTVAEKSREMATAQGQAIEAYIRVYVEKTGAAIEDIELVEQRHTEKEGVITLSWYCRRKERPPGG